MTHSPLYRVLLSGFNEFPTNSTEKFNPVNIYHKYWQARTQRQSTHDDNIDLNNTKYTSDLTFTHAYRTHTHTHAAVNGIIKKTNVPERGIGGFVHEECVKASF